MTTDQVNHPPHYGGDTTYEAIKVIEAWRLGFSLGNAVKYICRSGGKGKQLEDLRKAAWYLQREIEHMEAEALVAAAQPPPLTLEAQWRRQCRINGWDQNTPMLPGWAPKPAAGGPVVSGQPFIVGETADSGGA